MKLSIVIPFYNVEKYIAECLDSVYNQDIPEEEYEVICVNDCSPDKSRDIVLEYQKQHANLILVEHEVNKMLGAARNTGLRVAKGDYIWFIDSDDFIQDNSLSNLLGIIYSDNLEILQFNCYKHNSRDEKFQFFPLDTGVLTGIDYLGSNINNYWERIVTAWSKIYNRHLLLSNDLNFPEGVFFEDNLHTLKALLVCKRFRYIPEQVYYYRYNESSIMNTGYLGGIKLADRVRYEIECIDVLYNSGLSEELKQMLITSYTFHLSNRKKSILYYSVSELDKFYARISNIDRQMFRAHLAYKDSIIYLYPLLIRLVNFFGMQALRILRNYKRKMMTV